MLALSIIIDFTFIFFFFYSNKIVKLSLENDDKRMEDESWRRVILFLAWWAINFFQYFARTMFSAHHVVLTLNSPRLQIFIEAYPKF